MERLSGWGAIAALSLVSCAREEEASVDVAASALSVTTRIEAEDYDVHREWVPWLNAGHACDRGDGVDMERTTDPNGGGCNVGWTLPGESLGYTLASVSAQKVEITLRVASPLPWPRVRVLLDGRRLRTLHAMTGGWQHWEDRTLSDVAVTPGAHALTVVFETGGVNLNYLTWTGSEDEEPEPGPRAPLPWWLSYCDDPTCGGPPVVFEVCPDDDLTCTPSRETTVVPSVDGVQINQVLLPLQLPPGHSATYRSGNGSALGSAFVISYGGPIVIRSDVDLSVSYYGVPAVWGGTTMFDLVSESSDSPELRSTVYRHQSFLTQGEGAELHARGRTILARESELAEIQPGKVNAYFLPSELATQGEGNFADGNNNISINYGNPPYIAGRGGVYNAALPRFAHEYTHELFSEIWASYPGNNGCLNEGIADAFAYTAGFLPQGDFGPTGAAGSNYDLGCREAAARGEGHELGECPLWQVLRIDQLTPAFTKALLHPEHVIAFDSCNLSDERTGNALLVLFSDAAGRDMIEALTLAGIPNAGSYEAARTALGL